jgi:hypothetical protein
MKNLVKVCRFKDNATRLYQLPTCVVLERGTIVEVELANGSTALGVTVSTSYCGDYEERLFRDMFNILPATDFKRVVAIYDRQEVAWGAADSADETTGEAADETADETLDATTGEAADNQ